MKPVNILPKGWSKSKLYGDTRYYYHDETLDLDDSYVNIIDTRPLFGKRGASRIFFEQLPEQPTAPDYVIINKSTWSLDEMNMLTIPSNTKVVYPLEDVNEIHDIVSSYYVDCVILRTSRLHPMIEMINKLNNRKNMKPVWIDTTNFSSCSPKDFIKLATNPIITHCLATLVACMSAPGKLITYSWDNDWSSDFIVDLTSPLESTMIYKYNQYVMSSWCEGLNPLTFDEFLRGGK